MQQQIVTDSVKTAYDVFYQEHDEAWRMLGAKYKAQHIVDVCKGHTFNKVLEVGAGDGSILKLLAEQDFAREYDAVEISESGVEHIKARNIPGLRSVQVFDGYHLPFGDESFDLIILSHVLEHVEHERLLLRELKRVAKYCVIEVPRDYKADVDKKIKHFLAYGHINVYTPTSLRYLLKTEGFDIVSDLTSMIEPEVTRFNTYVNQKKPKSLITDLKISIEYNIKKGLIAFSGKKKNEEMANAYTVLCKKADQQPEIF
ncbi:class I SAM-dependent methyltransferase [Mucilaginibacter ginsenosidivorans]|uniref:Class I SAM-dependent methyltransferase n=1 Tax=Mucilaginibacter ginsenosidivorans TaxID=398053 RepID=A0A5B8UPZ2_9SPHI|nr:class I SAM-dependent methyltransferase [Mucilaginibacter ginsenosidivorans]QEC61137.1 class I SAM-dependent methyltransferase [Mucilaginibacter ginsenosidivorans]